MPENLGSLYVQLNIPEFMVFVAKNGKVIHTEKIVVGKPEYATPVFSADLKSIVFNPEWTVPPTIIREDLLPRLRGGGGHVRRQHLDPQAAWAHRELQRQARRPELDRLEPREHGRRSASPRRRGRTMCSAR